MCNPTEKLARFRWAIKDKLAGSVKPSSEDELRWLQVQGIKCIVSLTDMPLPFDLNELGFEQYHLPIEDFTAPTLEVMNAYVEHVTKIIAQNKPVLTHCGAGLGRTGTMLAVYLVSTCKTPEEAIKDVRKAVPGSVETKEQKQAIFEYARSLGKCK